MSIEGEQKLLKIQRNTIEFKETTDLFIFFCFFVQMCRDDVVCHLTHRHTA